MKETQRTVQWRVAGAEAAVDRTVRVAPLKEGQVRHEEGVSQHRLEEEAVKAKVWAGSQSRIVGQGGRAVQERTPVDVGFVAHRGRVWRIWRS